MYAILYDATKCVGCNQCVLACTNANHLDPELPDPTTEADGLSGRRWTSIVPVPGKKRYVKKQCLHCLHPSCVSACLVGAMTKSPQGPVLYDAGKCMGCRYCMIACPVGIPRYEWNKPIPYIQKCSLCAERNARGEKCACVAACTHGALYQGERDEMLKQAHGLIAENPGKYLDHVYGERELGGTNLLYVSDVPLDAVLRFPEVLREVSVPEMTWPVVRMTPAVALTALSLLVGTYWIIERRMRLAGENGQAHPDEPKPKPGAKP